jgi:hypothetical protein
MQTKKILMYGGGALAFGAVTYFVWAFFKKPTIPIDNTALTLGDDKEDGTKNNPFSSMNIDFKPIETPNIFADLDRLIKEGK